MAFTWGVKQRLLSHLGLPYIALRKRHVPKVILVEPTNRCNLRCPVCPTHFAMKRERGFMALGLFREIIDELKHLSRKPEIHFRMSGEPLLHPKIAELVSYAEAHGHFTMISSNCTVLNGRVGRDLIEAGLSEMVLAFDGLSKESYEAYRQGASFEKVKENIEGFAALKHALTRSKPKLIIQTLLTSASEREVDAIIDWARKIGVDQVNFKSLGMGTYTDSKMKKDYSYLLPEKKEFRRDVMTRVRYCIAPLKHIMIYWNGELGLCCKDFDNVVGLASIVDNGFSETFRSESVLRKREKGMRRQHALCAGCDMDRFSFKGYSVKFH